MLMASATNEEVLEFIDSWALLLEMEDYNAAFDLIKHSPEVGWTSQLIKEVIKAYGDGDSTQKVTLLNNGLATDGRGVIEKAIQRKDVNWYNETKGDVWYDLNIDGYVSDLTATFWLEKKDKEMLITLNDIHVM